MEGRIHSTVAGVTRCSLSGSFESLRIIGRENSAVRFFQGSAAPSLIMGELPLLGYAPWGRTSLEVVVFVMVVYSAIHVLVALLVTLVSRKRKYFPAIILGVLLGGLVGLQLGTAMRMHAYERAGERAAVLVSAIEHYIETTGAPRCLSA
ncbi:hypothetical protein P9775_005766 [Pseudomonas aeruginosa]|uniref:hypothetical protein n=1 Tax=Pseudomonas aeruginosa TaxID=287 RepID=UPI00129876BC|nr:hypothetical protein [Pseudomonas aeruginosa]EIZ0544646.1 hypothetical protein [Pseudomonas aeruginosa]EKV4131780.1 hypothetical protein [Pseudomonas aeruginosa]EKW0412932.1 hypothetical protein [Pseudomonas aeruginosa]EKW1422089.1 hypothetical protein [Pseudomonas aeruginosa]EKW1536024.1 hypothetical protein [Pseudomonas aeruginosa]